MKLSKSLLSSLAVGLALGTCASSCTADFMIPVVEEEGETIRGEHGERGDGTCEVNWEDCPACGMG